jgi:hypothetical protein
VFNTNSSRNSVISCTLCLFGGTSFKYNNDIKTKTKYHTVRTVLRFHKIPHYQNSSKIPQNTTVRTVLRFNGSRIETEAKSIPLKHKYMKIPGLVQTLIFIMS